MANQIRIEAQLVWLAAPGENPGKWIGVCEELDIAVEGDSLDELHSLIPEAIHLLMTDLVEDNEFDAFLRAKGWSHRPVTDGVPDGIKFDVPWQLIAEGANDPQREAH